MDNTVGSRQQDLIVGTLLGDGFLERNGVNFRLVIDHSTKQLDYLKWKQNCLQTLKSKLVIKSRFDNRTGKTYEHCILRTETTPYLLEFLKLFYINNRKIIPRNLPSILNPQILAIWLMDDGYKRNDCNAVRLNTQSYTFNEQMLVQESLQTLGITSHIQKHKSQFVIYIPSSSMTKLRQLVSPFVIESMKYKVA